MSVEPKSAAAAAVREKPHGFIAGFCRSSVGRKMIVAVTGVILILFVIRSEEHTSELQSRQYLVCRLLLEKKKRSDYSLAQLKKALELYPDLTPTRTSFSWSFEMTHSNPPSFSRESNIPSRYLTAGPCDTC